MLDISPRQYTCSQRSMNLRRFQKIILEKYRNENPFRPNIITFVARHTGTVTLMLRLFSISHTNECVGRVIQHLYLVVFVDVCVACVQHPISICPQTAYVFEQPIVALKIQYISSIAMHTVELCMIHQHLCTTHNQYNALLSASPQVDWFIVLCRSSNSFGFNTLPWIVLYCCGEAPHTNRIVMKIVPFVQFVNDIGND